MKIGLWKIVSEVNGKGGREFTKTFIETLSALPAIKEWYEQTNKEIESGERGNAAKNDFPGKNLFIAEVFTDESSIMIFKKAILDFKKELSRSTQYR